MAIIQGGSSTAGTANVDAGFNLNVTLPTNPAYMGGVRIFSEVDAGDRTGTPELTSPEASDDYRLRVCQDYSQLEWQWNAATQNTAKFKHGFTTMTANQSGAVGYLLLNAAFATVAGNGCSLQSWKYVSVYGSTTVYHATTFVMTALPLANQVWEHGHFVTTVPTPVTPADGIFVRVTSAGLIGVLAFNGVETHSGVLVPFSDFTAMLGTNQLLIIGSNNRNVEFWLDRQNGDGIQKLGEIAVPAGNSQPMLSVSLPAFATQMRNSGLVGAGGMQVKIGNGYCQYSGVDMQQPITLQSVLSGLHLMQGWDGGTMGSTAALPNATAATTLTLAALAQATSLKTGLGGEAGITATVPGVDGSVWAWINPLGSTTQTARTALVSGIHIESVNIGAAVTTTPSTIQWSADIGSTALTLATAESASFATGTAKAGRRIPLGIQSWTVGALVGAAAPSIDLKFDPPIAVNPGEYVKIVGKFIQGTATASQGIWATCAVQGTGI